MLVVGLVGRIGSGKSTVARRFAALGADVLDADAIAHQVLDEPAVRAEVVGLLGDGVVGGDGRIDRAAVAARVFGDAEPQAEALRGLEAIVHPRVRARIDAELGRLRAAAGAGRRVVVLDVPLLVQAGWVDACDRVVLVECAAAERRRRLEARGWTAGQIAARDAAWNRGYGAGPPSAKTSVVDASRDPSYTFSDVDRIWGEWHRES